MSLAVAERWFECHPLADGVTLILESHVDPWLRANIWHVRGRDRDLLVDTGLGLGSLRREVARLAERPVLAIATHGHFDHMGGHHEFPERACHPADARCLSAPDGDNTMAGMFVTATTITALPRAGYEIADYAVRPAPPSRLLEDGDVLDTGDRTFRVLHLPGHSPGSLALHEPASGLLFSGDMAYEGDLIDGYPTSSPDDFRASMERLLEVPVALVHPGHYGSFGPERLRAICRDYIAHGAPPLCPSRPASWQPAG